ncbi:hypothetical protein O181_003468 [Austropuccinia psidii MF-1]|uniref:Uncharacterized protein n=1 Tax=Austropuccinia psidii MF-1 TaxID=1389203 RepID=A0A9Q3BEQ9_9BASI|nr:hypothetical protein [Austropuccinia psidii MF-1]
MSFSLKPKSHINTIHNLWVITPHGSRQDNLPPLPSLLSCMNWLLHPLIISTCCQCLRLVKDMLLPLSSPIHGLPQPHLIISSTPEMPSRFPSAPWHAILALTHPYTSTPLPNPLLC